MAGTFWSVIPPVISIILALITKEVYLSLFVGILSGALFYTGFDIIGSFEILSDIAGSKIAENINIIIFLILLGTLVALMSKSGASSSYGKWASERIKSKKGAMTASAVLGAMIFVDDYFNCLTVGTVMRPITDRFRISREKLAFIIDSTAAPVCILAPVSSWAAAVGSSLSEIGGNDSFSMFVKTIPFNFYAILTIITVILVISLDFDFSGMKRYDNKEDNIVNGNEKIDKKKKGKVFDLAVPIFLLIFYCLAAMLLTGGFFRGKSLFEAFGDCNSSLSLVLGSFAAVVSVFFLYVPRKVVSFKDFMNSLSEGFASMVPAIMILAFAWTLSGICGGQYMDTGGFIKSIISQNTTINIFLPLMFFITAAFLAFSTGTSWGTFGILIPIASSMLYSSDENLFIISVAAVLSGAVCGDHISPISDTTILASTGAGCDHINHVSSQLPYCIMSASGAAAGYITAGITRNGWVGLIMSVVILAVIFVLFYLKGSKRSYIEKSSRKK